MRSSNGETLALPKNDKGKRASLFCDAVSDEEKKF